MYLNFLPFQSKFGCHYFEHLPKDQSAVYNLFKRNRHCVLWTKTCAENEAFVPQPVKSEHLAMIPRRIFRTWNAEDCAPTANSKSLKSNHVKTVHQKLQFEQRRQGKFFFLLQEDSEKIKQLCMKFLESKQVVSE
jgi:hypothetical protein